MFVKRMKWLVILLSVFAIAYGVYQSNNGALSETQHSTEEEASSIQGESITIVDSADRTVTVPLNPDHIATLYAVSGHITCMLDRGEHIVAVNNGLKRDVILNELVPTIGDATMAVSSGKINMESLLEREIDLAFISLDMYHDTAQIKQLETFNIPYVVVDFQSIEDQKNVVTFMGKILDANEEAEHFIAFYDDVIAILDKALSGLTEDEKIRVYHSINEANCTVSNNTFASDWMKYAGGRNVSLGTELEKDGDKYYTNLEQIILWNPDIIFCNEWGVPAYILDNPQWQLIEAVKAKRVYQLPIGISRWGHKTSIETPLAMLWVANTLYPERITTDIQEVAGKYYQTLFEFELTDDMYAQMLKGETMRLSKDTKEVVQ